MKPNKSRLHRGSLENSPRGFSLVLVLLILTLLTVLIFSFFLQVTGELSNTTAYANGKSTANLSENVIQLMEGQIKDATTAAASGSGTYSWASQPGMIRTYDTSGNGLMFYKLYSSDNMRTVWSDAGTYQSKMADDRSPTDMADPAQFTDLNSSVNNVHPIADPDALTGANGANLVAGFSVDATTAPTNVAGTNVSANNDLPMPVRWLYKLQDGTLVAAPSGGTSGTVDLKSLGASVTNPIVGRVAFWTDDETSKVNINTAAEGTYWDTPRFWGSAQPTGNIHNLIPNPALSSTSLYPDPEYAYAMSQPAQYEFQRYPGHPAQVALSPIFPKLITSPNPAILANAMAKIAPFLAPGGSAGGTLTFNNPSNLVAGVLDLSKAQRKSPYATVDEFLYGTVMAGATSRALTDPTATYNIVPATVQASKFFITANSRAPELNLFGQPRIACWPISNTFSLISSPSTNQYTSIFDRLIAFCSSLKTGDKTYMPYYFQRSRPNDPTFDFSGIGRNMDLYTYLQNLTNQPIPGFGGNFSSKYSSDRDQILTEIFDYIRCTDLCDPAVYNPNQSPALQRTFAASIKSPNDSSNITYPVTPIKIGSTMGFGRMPVVDQVGLCLICMIDGNNIDYGGTPTSNPLASLTTPYTKTPSALIPDYGNIIAKVPGGLPNKLTSSQKIIQAAFFMEGYNPSFGPPEYTPNMYLSVNGLDTIAFGPPSENPPGTAPPPSPFASAVNDTPFCVRAWDGGIVDGPFLGPQDYAFNHSHSPSQFMNSATTYTYAGAPSGSNFYYYPCISKPFLVTVQIAGQKIALPVTAGNLQIKMLTGNVNGSTGKLQAPTPNTASYGTVYQTISFTFPTTAQMVMEDPTLDPASASWSFAKRISGAATFPATGYPGAPQGGNLWGPNDVVKSFFLVEHGDSRLLAANGTPHPAPPLQGSPAGTAPNYNSLYSNFQAPFAHFFREQTGPLLTGVLDLSTTLVPVATAAANPYKNTYPLDTPATSSLSMVHVPLMPWALNPPAFSSKAQNCYKNGDFDNLIACWPDGPGINKPDEGDSGGIGGGAIGNHVPYLATAFSDTAGRGITFFTPNRILPSPGMFGSLPTGIQSDTPWQTLLFRPQPPLTAAGYTGHTEAAVPAIKDAGYNQYTTPPDHLFMDLFWMPIVEPYAISDSFSTAGKINMNYRIEPFNYIDRNTSLVCLLKNEKILAVPETASLTYKALPNTRPADANRIFRLGINPDESKGSLRQFKTRFDAGDIFRSASEICDIFLVPDDVTGTPLSWTGDSDAATFWGTHRLTGDNSRERPYTNLYGRLTTKSNSFTIHMRVQTLKQSLASRNAGKWVETTDTITGEYRGSSLIERYLDPNENLPDFAASGAAGNLDSYYKFRVVRNTQFTP